MARRAGSHKCSSLEAYQRSGNLARQADVLSTLGVLCQWEGRWDEALSYYERGRKESLKVGETVGAALARVNMAEILMDRGEWAEAEALLLETLPLWRAAQWRYYLGACLSYLGRVSLCLGRPDEALSRLEEAKATFLNVGAEEQVPAIDARIAECHVATGNVNAALELSRGLLGRAGKSNGVARVVSLLERVQKRRAAEAGRHLGRARRVGGRPRRGPGAASDLFEVALDVAVADRVRPIGGRRAAARDGEREESRQLLSSLKVRAVPPIPSPPQ